MPRQALSIRIVGLEPIIKGLSVLGKIKIPAAIAKGLDLSSRYVLTNLIQNTPVDTGNLALSETIFPESDQKVLVGPDLSVAHYAPFVERGHHTTGGSFVPGQFFIEKTAIETRSGVIEIFNQLIKNVV